jgi:hypothetical protein
MMSDTPRNWRDYNPVKDAKPFVSPSADLTHLNEAFENSAGKVQGGEGGHQSGHWMSNDQMAELIANFVKVGKTKAEVIEALEGSGYTVPAELRK